MLEAIGTALLIHLGKSTIDRFWGAQKAGNSAVVNQSGHLAHTNLHDGRTVVNRRVTLRTGNRAPALLNGYFYLFGSLQSTVVGKETALVLVEGETEHQTFLFDADLNSGYQIYLTPSVYSIFCFLVDGEAESLFDTPVYAIGFPSAIDLTGIDRLDFDDPAAVWSAIDESPVRLASGLDYYLDFILIDAEQVLGYPPSFNDILQIGDVEGAADAAGLISCPRCGGDGHVSRGDLNRIRAMGHHIGDWGPGPCRLCQGKGVVSSNAIRSRDVGNTPREEGK